MGERERKEGRKRERSEMFGHVERTNHHARERGRGEREEGNLIRSNSRHDETDGLLQSRDDDVLDSVDSAVGCSDDFVEDGESRLFGGSSSSSSEEGRRREKKFSEPLKSR